MIIVRLFAGILSLIVKCLSLIMKGLQYLLAYGGGFLILGAIIMFVAQGFKQDTVIIFITGIVSAAIGLLFMLLELDEKLDDVSTDLALFFYGPSSETYSTSSSSSYSTDSSYSGSSGYTDSSTSSYDWKYHDELDAVQHAMHISETYGDDWRGYDPEAPGPDPETYVNIDL